MLLCIVALLRFILRSRLLRRMEARGRESPASAGKQTRAVEQNRPATRDDTGWITRATLSKAGVARTISPSRESQTRGAVIWGSGDLGTPYLSNFNGRMWFCFS